MSSIPSIWYELATKASMQRPYDNQIINPLHLFEFAQSEIPTVSFYYNMVKHYEQEDKLLLSIFSSARTIAGTHKLHSFRPISSELVEVREFSTSPERRVE